MSALRIRAARCSVILALCSVGLMAVPGGNAVGRVSPAPKAVLPFTSFTFGDIYTGEIISQVFVIKNEGDADLETKDFKGDCGCTTARSDRVIPAGAEGTAEVEVQTISQSGLIYKTATLHTNDPNKPVIVFTLNANVIAGPRPRLGKHIGPIFLSPGSQAALFAAPGQKAMTELSVTADDAPVKVLRLEGGTKYLAPRVEVVEPGRSYKIVVESLPNGTGGLYRDRLRVVTDNPTLPAFTIDVALRVYESQ